MTRVEELRRAFDRAFADPPATAVTRFEELLAIGLGDAPFALRLREVAGLFADKPITRVPSPIPELLGIAGFRGVAVPVYDLRALLGLGSAERPRWTLLVTAKGATAPGPTVALAFERFDGLLRVAPGEAVLAGSTARTIMTVSSVLQTITRRVEQRVAPRREP